MGKDEAATLSKSEKTSSTAQEQVAVHPYPDWAAMQAYYGPGVPLSSYFSATVAPGHAPHPYMWGPQPLVPPFGTPYTAIYPHGVYSHPSVSFVTSPSTDVSAKSSSNKDKGLMKNLNGFDGLAVAIGYVNAETLVARSHSGETEVEISSEGSDNNEPGGKETPRKRSRESTPISGNRKAHGQVSADYGREVKVAPNLSSGVTRTPSTVVGKPLGATPVSSLTPSVSSLTPSVEVRAPTTNQPKAGVHAEKLVKDERAVKREKRKQSNRESARRSRLKKQVETEELAVKVESLSAENTTLRSEIARLKENSEKLKTENYALTEKLKNVQATSPDELAKQKAPSVVVENFLSRIDKLREEDAQENSSGSKLYQLLDSSPRADAMAAG